MVRLSKRYDKAVKFARKEHKSQRRKGTEIPYISHLLAVSVLVLEMEGSEDEAIAGLLHDVVEDCGGQPMLERVRDEFGEDVARIVWANSDTDVKPKPPWRKRKQDYLDSLATKQRDELLVSLADKLHNARAILLDHRAIGEAVWPRFQNGKGDREQQLWYYDELVKAFTARADDLGPQCARQLDDFQRTIAELRAE
ncbi:MAG: HD domain-containing protein [Solirubrobacterales bacterium]